ncbi:hypothetical protein EGM85_12210 [Macrococcus caseolyticus]|nr:hypothetical protein [Macrococcus caseolyticus]RKO09619.1 hypothetical protein D6861_12210 [Macrococcus caseolyticus]
MLALRGPSKAAIRSQWTVGNTSRDIGRNYVIPWHRKALALELPQQVAYKYSQGQLATIKSYHTNSKYLNMTNTTEYSKKFKACVVGSGNWGTAVAKLVAENCAEKHQYFESEVNMWVFEEELEGRKLTELINEKHENVKYLPDIKLPKNLRANPDLKDVVDKTNIVVINITHQ